MSLWILEPRDPLAVRDGRPNNGRSESTTLPFPYPGTIAGIVRTRLGSDAHGVFEMGRDLKALLGVGIRGPLLARLDGGLYVRPPRDAVLGAQLRRLIPDKRGLAEGTLVDDAFPGAPLCFASEHAPPAGKSAEPHAWWPWELLARWLATPKELDGKDAGALLCDALPALPLEVRSHVKLTETWTAEDGMLFQTRGLRFTTEALAPLAMAIDVDAEATPGRALRPGIGPCGGERRLARWTLADPSLRLPALPQEVRKALAVKEEACVRVRVVLLTPAIFTAGWRPGSLPGELLGLRHGITPRLVAACVPRPDTLSGWNFATQPQQPKKTRRLVRAGSVYWIDLEGTPDDRVRWADDVMMTNVSDAPQDQLDGFGLAAVGVGS
jgi:CRISPR-associated protein Cmr3